jgi:hypothetical protein
MTAVRLAISVFIALLIVVSAAGWIWTGGNQPHDQWVASRVVLAIGALTGALGLIAIWRPERPG